MLQENLQIRQHRRIAFTVYLFYESFSLPPTNSSFLSDNTGEIELKVRESTEKVEWDDSPESLIIPHEDVNTKQQKITGERLPSIILELR